MSELGFTVFAPGYLSTQQMFDIAQHARNLAEALGFQQIQPVVGMEYDEIERLLPRLENYELMDPVFCRLFGMEPPVDYELWAVHMRRLGIPKNPDDEEHIDIVYLPPQRLVGFHASGGRGCTEFRLTFAQYPLEVFEADSRLVFGWWAEDAVYEHGAYAYGEAHFVQCHLRHILLLKALKRRFPMLKMKISDATGYWKTGSLDTLLRRVRKLLASEESVQNLLRPPGTMQMSPKVSTKAVKVTIPRDELRHFVSRN